jgi:hypothetical protein
MLCNIKSNFCFQARLCYLCNIEKCSLWDETLENVVQEFDTVVETQAIVDLASDEEFEDQRTGGEMSLEAM